MVWGREFIIKLALFFGRNTFIKLANTRNNKYPYSNLYIKLGWKI